MPAIKKTLTRQLRDVFSAIGKAPLPWAIIDRHEHLREREQEGARETTVTAQSETEAEQAADVLPK